MTLGVGLGSDRTGELEAFGEVVPARERAQLLDQGLERLSEYWAGEFEPTPVQTPRIPVWVAGRWKSRRRPLERAARWDGFFPIGPWLVTADEIADPHDLDIQLTLNGETRQKSNTRNLIYDIPYLIANLSETMTLLPPSTRGKIS